jgi:hypothetical protein
MEYFLQIPMPPTKDELQAWFSEYQKERGEAKHFQPNLF